MTITIVGLFIVILAAAGGCTIKFHRSGDQRYAVGMILLTALAVYWLAMAVKLGALK